MTAQGEAGRRAPTRLPRGLVIVGFPRSGTTALRQELARAGRSDLCVHEIEPGWLLDLVQAGITDRTAALDFLGQHRKFPAANRFEGLNIADLDKAFEGTDFADPACVLADTMRAAHGKQVEEQLLVIKHPALAMHLGLVRRLFESTTVVNVTRNPYDAVASHRARWPSKDLGFAARLWRDSIRAVATENEAVDIVTVRYEELERELDTGSLSHLLAPASNRQDGSREVDEGGFRTGGIDSASIGRGASRLSTKELDFITEICRSEMVESGYAPRPQGERLLASLRLRSLLGSQKRKLGEIARNAKPRPT